MKRPLGGRAGLGRERTQARKRNLPARASQEIIVMACAQGYSHLVELPLEAHLFKLLIRLPLPEGHFAWLTNELRKLGVRLRHPPPPHATQNSSVVPARQRLHEHP